MDGKPDQHWQNWRGFAAVIASFFLISAVRASVTLPDETFSSPGQLSALVLDLRQGNAEPAAEKIKSLLDHHASELYRSGDDALISIGFFASGLTMDHRADLVAAFDQHYGSAAAAALARVRAKPLATVGDFYAVARMYPLSSSAATAYTLAADRALSQGDLLTAAEMARLTRAAGQSPTAMMSAVWAAESAMRANPAASGPLPFDAHWNNLPTGFESPKVIPVGSAQLAFVSGERSVVALQGDGTVRWRSPLSIQNQNGRGRFHPIGSGRGPLSVPAVLCDIHDEPMMVITRLPAQGDWPGRLFGFRGTDGKPLWSTQADLATDAIDFLSTPAVAGRYAVAVGIDTNEDPNSAQLLAVALDVCSGRLLWRCPLAALGNADRGQSLDLYGDQSPPCIDGHQVLICPSVGAAFAIDLFSGELQWIRPYHATKVPEGTIRRFVDQRDRGRELIAPINWVDILRWHCTPMVDRDLVLLAPQDTSAMMGVDRLTARVIWTRDRVPQATPVGVAAGKLILSGSSITAFDTATGDTVWTFTPQPGMRLTGPAVVRQGSILVRSTAGLLRIDPRDGTAKTDQESADFHPISASEAGKAALAGDGLSQAFGD